MTAEEIRALRPEQLGNPAEFERIMMREIAAQLATLNEFLAPMRLLIQPRTGLETPAVAIRVGNYEMRRP